MASATAFNLLRKQFRELSTKPIEGVSCGLVNENLLHWRVTIIGHYDSIYADGFFVADLKFPETYPNQPPTMTFLTPMWHPNIYENGTVCISILHPPGEDMYGYEDAGERWLPVHTVETIIVSVMSLLYEERPDTGSPANLEAAIEVRENLKAYRRKVRSLAQKSADNNARILGDE